MTAKIDLTEQPRLTIYQVAEFWNQEEVNTPRVLHLKRMAKGVGRGELKIQVTNPFPDEFPNEWIREFSFTNLEGEWVSCPAEYALSYLFDLAQSDELDEREFLKSFTNKCILKFSNKPFPEGLGFFAQKNLKEILSAILINQDDFGEWCQQAGYPLPQFWFGENHLPKQKHCPNLELEVQEEVKKAFWKESPPEGHNRPTKKKIVDWVLEHYQSKGITNKAAERIFKATRPDHIPKHGNLPNSKKPYPTPPSPHK